MKIYRVILLFKNLDNSLYTDWQANMAFEIQSDDVGHAHLLAERLRKVMDADEYKVE